MGRIVGAVLTGGASRRMGRTKALVPYRGAPLAARVLFALGDGGCDPVVLVGGDAEELAVLGFPVLPDRWPDEGPLGGVLSALGALGEAESVVVTACDLGELTGETVRRIIDGPPGAAVVVAFGTRRHPTLARYHSDVERDLEAIFTGGERSLMGALGALERRGVDVVDVTVEEKRLKNVNDAGDLAC